ncbi:MAG: hypothetical protein WCY36_04155 [Candidatus Omnitrophota bacterium]
MVRKIFLHGLLIIIIAFAAHSWAEQFKYDSRGKRDPFVPLIGQDKLSNRSIPLSEISSVEDIVLEGIAAQTTGARTALVNGELVKEKFKAGEIEVKKITKNSILIIMGGKEYTIYLPEQGGQKSD